MNIRTRVLVSILLLGEMSCHAGPRRLRPDSDEVLQLPTFVDDAPGAGRHVAVSPPEYEGTQVFHSLYLPADWSPERVEEGERWPVIFEYTGNYFPPCASTGEPEDAALGFGLSGGAYIWVSLPYVSVDGQDNAVTWWGDVDATVRYAKTNVPRILEAFGGNSNAVFLCGFSRGSIAVNYIGLHDDEISGLWSAFVTHDHFDGARAWEGKAWGSPLASYQQEAAGRLKRVGGRPYMVGTKADSGVEAFVTSVLGDTSNFFFHNIRMNSVFPEIPNDLVIHSHNDRWLLVPSAHRQNAWRWMNRVVESAP